MKICIGYVSGEDADEIRLISGNSSRDDDVKSSNSAESNSRGIAMDGVPVSGTVRCTHESGTDAFRRYCSRAGLDRKDPLERLKLALCRLLVERNYLHGFLHKVLHLSELGLSKLSWKSLGRFFKVF